MKSVLKNALAIVLTAATIGMGSVPAVVDDEATAAELSGSVTIAGDPNPSGSLAVVGVDGAVVRTGSFAGGGNSEVPGGFTLTDIPPGSYRIRYRPDDTTYYPTWQGGVTTSMGATVVTVTAGAHIELPPQAMVKRSTLPTGSLTLRVSGPDGEAVDALDVSVFDRDGFAVAGASTTRGAASFSLPAAAYRFRIADRAPSLPGYYTPWRHRYDTQWWGGASLETAKAINLAKGVTTRTDVRVTRSLPSDSRTITGRVTAGGLGMPGVMVSVRTSPRPQEGGSVLVSGYTDDAGRYRITGLPADIYRIAVQDDPRWSAPRPSIWLTTDIDVRTRSSAVADADLGAITAHTTSLRARVVASDTGKGLSGLPVTVTDSNGYDWLGRGPIVSDEGGWFEFIPWYDDQDYTFTVGASGRYASVTKTISFAPRIVHTAVLTAPQKLATATPTLPERVAVGKSVTATVKGWTGETSFTYQWKRNGSAIKGATKKTYTPAAADRGRKLSVTVTGRKTGFAAAARTSTAKVVAYGTLTSAAPKISGTRKVGKKLTVVPGAWTAGVSFSYQWYANGTRIKGATKKTYVLTSRERGDQISVKVTARKAGYTTLPRTSPRTAKIAR